jgi:hypothetical protein
MALSRAFLLVLVLFALLPLTTFSASYPMQVHCIMAQGQLTDLNTCVSDSIAISVIGLLLSLAVVAISYMIGEVLNMGNLRGWYRRELWETAKSAMIIIVIYSALVLFGSVGAALAGSAQSTGQTLLGGATLAKCEAASSTFSTTPASSGLEVNLAALYNTAVNSYLEPTLCNTYTAFSAMMGLTMGIRTAMNLEVVTHLGIPILPWPPLAQVGALQFGSTTKIFYSTYLDSDVPTQIYPTFLQTIMRVLILPTLVQLQIQSDLLPLIVSVAIGVFLPIGIILRAIPFLRGIGGTLIAIAVGIAIVYPVMLVTFNLPITDYFMGLTSKTAAAPTFTCPGGIAVVACWLIKSVPAPFTDTAIAASVGSTIATSGGDTAAANTGYNVGFWDYTLALRSIIPAMNVIDEYSIDIILQFIIFAIDLLLGVVIIQAIAKSLGGQLRLSLGKRIRIA